jgi:uncharacterized protein
LDLASTRWRFWSGVSHGVQQINFIVRELASGKTTMQAARSSFSGLLLPGTLALVTAFVSFITLLLIPIPMIRELAITASLGVGFKIFTNLIMLPIVASYFNFTKEFAENAMLKRQQRAQWIKVLAQSAVPRNSVIIVILGVAVLGLSIWESRDRVIGTVLPGAPELRADSRFNRDATSIAGNFDVGLDWLSIVMESPAESCENAAVGLYVDGLTIAMSHVPGVMDTTSYARMLKTYNQGYNEGNPNMFVVPIDPTNYSSLTEEVRRQKGYVNKDCSMEAVHLYLADHKAVTIKGVVNAARAYALSHPETGMNMRLAGGNAGVLAAINDEVEKSELPMILWVYVAILVLVFLVYNDFRAMISCCTPLTVGSFIGYWFMKEFDIGLTVATLPVMVLAVGIGVDYALYIYNRLQLHLTQGDSFAIAMNRALEFEGMATIFTAITLAVGVATWSFSELKFQADMGRLLAFMFIVNLIMAMTLLPAIAVVLEKLFPRKGCVHLSRFAH